MSTSTGEVTKGEGGHGGALCANTDPGEPNDAEAMAYKLGEGSCSGDEPGKIYGVLAGPKDVDWFVYHGEDGLTCSVNPTSRIVVETGSARVCAYAACEKGTTQLGACPAYTSMDISPSGLPGCCGLSDFTLALNCKGTSDDSALVYLRVDDPTKSAVCAGYTVTYHF